mgnify:CR=1 FL=1
MREIKNTEEAIDVITRAYNVRENGPVYPDAIYWAPGDMTRYVVALLKMKPLEAVSEKLTTVLFISSGGTSLVIPGPSSPFNTYSAELFLAKFGERYAGWWGGVRPLLAGLGWTPEGARNTEFSNGDAAFMGTLLSRR